MRTNAAFWDTSAIIPLCVRQDATPEARRVRRLYSTSVVWCATKVEIHSSLFRLKRTGELDTKGCDIAIKQWTKFHALAREVRAIDALLAIAVELPEKYGLRSLDSFQLAAALVWCNERPRNRPFICADKRLGDAASEAGFDVIALI